MKILVTGGAGFIGSHIVDEYIKLGHEVGVIDNLSTGKREYVNPQAQFFQTDIQEKKEIQNIFTTFKPEILNHHAAQMDVRKSVADPLNDAQINILGLITLLEAGRINNLKQVIFASSGGAVYGDTEILPTSETYLPQPASPYGVSKLASEFYLHFYFRTYSIGYVALRYGNVYGPRQNPHGEAGVVAIFTQKILRGEQPVINGDGSQSRDFVYVSDIVSANKAALLYKGNLIVNIGTGRATDVNQIYRELSSLTHTNTPEIHGPVKLGEQKMSLLDIKKAYKELRWKTQIDLNEGLKSTVAFFQNEK